LRARSRRNPQGTPIGAEENHGLFEYGIETIQGSTTVVPFTIWLPKIDTANAVKIQSPTQAEAGVAGVRPEY
jgi:hypothetical protein